MGHWVYSGQLKTGQTVTAGAVKTISDKNILSADMWVSLDTLHCLFVPFICPGRKNKVFKDHYFMFFFFQFSLTKQIFEKGDEFQLFFIQVLCSHLVQSCYRLLITVYNKQDPLGQGQLRVRSCWQRITCITYRATFKRLKSFSSL